MDEEARRGHHRQHRRHRRAGGAPGLGRARRGRLNAGQRRRRHDRLRRSRHPRRRVHRRASAENGPESRRRARRDDPADEALLGLHGPESAIADGFAYAGQHGIPVVIESLGGPGSSTAINSAMAAYPGTLYVIASGTTARTTTSSRSPPASTNLTNVLCVGASTITDTRRRSQLRPEHVDLFAPGQHDPLDLPGLDVPVARRHVDGIPVRRRHRRPRRLDHDLRGAALAHQIEATIDPSTASRPQRHRRAPQRRPRRRAATVAPSRPVVQAVQPAEDSTRR